MPEQGRVCVCPQCGKKYALKEGFDAKSFSCKACGATVWVAGKPPAPVPTSSKGAVPRPASKGARGGRGAPVAAASHGAHRRSRRGEREEAAEEGGGRRGRGREKPKSNTNLFLAIGGVAVVGIIVLVVVLMGKKDAPAGTGGTAAAKPVTETPTDTADPTPTPDEPEKPAGGAPAAVNETKKPEEAKPAPSGEEPEESPSPEGGETTKPKLGDRPPTERKSKWDPPADLGHLETTSPEQRKQIDEWIVLMLDPQAGRDSLDAKEKLAAVGKPAFLPILGAMAKIRDTIADTDSPEERLIESSLKLADECLRLMDGYLDGHEKAPIRPGTDKAYIGYVLRMHYRRWMDGAGSTPLKDMETMPGAYDPSTAYKDEGAEEEEK